MKLITEDYCSYETAYYIIRTEDGWCAVTMYYRTSEKEYWWNFEKTKVTHWMEIPKLKGGEK